MATKTCDHCPAQFSGEGASDALAQHQESFHPDAPATPVALREPAAEPGTVAAVPTVDAEARSAIGELGRRFNDLADRVTTLEQPDEAVGGPEPPKYADLQARAKELGIPASGTIEALSEAIAAEEQRRIDAGSTTDQPPA